MHSSLIGHDRSDLKPLLESQQQPSFRAEQIYKWLYSSGIRDPEQFTNMPKSFRLWLSGEFAQSSLEVSLRTASNRTDLVKYLFELHDGKLVEGVWIPDDERGTLCVSSQVGCAIGCTFCATGTMGLIRNLSSGEIIDQLLTVRFREQKFISNVVFMGMGEPLHNYDAVSKAVRIMNDPAGCAIGKRHITVSTSGWVPGIYRMIEDKLPCRLAISMGSPQDETRSTLMPVTRKYSIDELFGAAKDWAQAFDDRVTIEYTLLDGVNDQPSDLRLLVKRLHGIPAKINVLTYNPGPDAVYARPSDSKVAAFASELEKHFPGTVTRRMSRGDEIGAACGQLVIESDRKRIRSATAKAR